MAHVCLHTPLCAKTRETVFTYYRVLTHTLSILTRLILTHPHFVLIVAQYATMPLFVSTHRIHVPDVAPGLLCAHRKLYAVREQIEGLFLVDLDRRGVEGACARGEQLEGDAGKDAPVGGS